MFTCWTLMETLFGTLIEPLLFTVHRYNGIYSKQMYTFTVGGNAEKIYHYIRERKLSHSFYFLQAGGSCCSRFPVPAPPSVNWNAHMNVIFIYSHTYNSSLSASSEISTTLGSPWSSSSTSSPSLEPAYGRSKNADIVAQSRILISKYPSTMYTCNPPEPAYWSSKNADIVTQSRILISK